MKRIIYLCCCLLVGLTGCQSNVLTVDIVNTLNLIRENETVAIEWAQIADAFPNATPTNIIVQDASGAQILSQTSPTNAPIPSKLLFQANIGALDSATYFVRKGKPRHETSQVFCMPDTASCKEFSWGNNLAKYRINGTGIDLLLENGADTLSVSCGGTVPYSKGKVWLEGNKDSFSIIDNGPLRVSFQLVYNALPIENRTVKMERTFTLDANYYINHITTRFLGDFDTLTVASGIAYNNPFFEKVTENAILLCQRITTSKATNVESLWHLLAATVQPIQGIYIRTTGYTFIQSSVTNGFALETFAGGVQSLEDYITTPQEWEDYLIYSRLKKKNPLVITLR